MSSSSCKQSHRAIWQWALKVPGYSCVASSLASGPLPSPQAGLGLIPLFAWGSPSQPTGLVCAPHPSTRHSKAQSNDCFSLPYLGYNHYQPICENYLPRVRAGQGTAGRRVNDTLHPECSACLLPSHEWPSGTHICPQCSHKKKKKKPSQLTKEVKRGCLEPS